MLPRQSALAGVPPQNPTLSSIRFGRCKLLQTRSITPAILELNAPADNDSVEVPSGVPLCSVRGHVSFDRSESGTLPGGRKSVGANELRIFTEH